MADSDYTATDTGSNVGGDNPGATKVDQMSEKERKKWDKNLESWRIFLDFIFRHISIVTYKYNCFEREDLTYFMIALEKGEMLKEQFKKKKTDDPYINGFKSMHDCADLLFQHRYINESNQIRRFLDIVGRLKCLGMIAGGFFKALKKAKVNGIDGMRYTTDYWKGFSSRNFDFRELEFKNTNIEAFGLLEKRYIAWPTAVRTTICLAQRFLKQVCNSTGMDLLTPDQKGMQRHMQAAEFVLAARLEERLFNRVAQSGSKSFLRNPLITGQTASPTPDNAMSKWTMPDISDIDPSLLRSIPEDGMLLVLPAEPPKDAKKGKGKKGKKGGGGGKKKKKK